jgi:hypothetical protein
MRRSHPTCSVGGESGRNPVCDLSGTTRTEREVDVARRKTNPERSAGEFLAAELTAAPDALWRIRRFHALVRKYNLNLEVQRQLFPPSSGKIGGPHREHEAGEQPDGKM